MKKAVVLFSGGLDSTTVLYLARSQGYEVHTLTFDYGQRHKKEIDCAKNIANSFGVTRHITVKTNMDAWGGSALTDESLEIPIGNEESKDIPLTYVPARNMVFLSYAASFAEAIDSQDIFIGVSEVDYSGYVDCRKEFIDAMETTINLGTVCAVEHNKKIKIHTPFINMTKSEEVRLGLTLGVDYSSTWTCYSGGLLACGVCDSCLLRLKAFSNAGFIDPIKYEKR